MACDIVITVLCGLFVCVHLLAGWFVCLSCVISITVMDEIS